MINKSNGRTLTFKYAIKWRGLSMKYNGVYLPNKICHSLNKTLTVLCLPFVENPRQLKSYFTFSRLIHKPLQSVWFPLHEPLAKHRLSLDPSKRKPSSQVNRTKLENKFSLLACFHLLEHGGVRSRQLKEEKNFN